MQIHDAPQSSREGLEYSAREARQITRQSTGILIPVYLPPGGNHDLQLELLADNVEACIAVVDDPQVVCLIADGPDCGGAQVEELASTYSVTAAVTQRNRGKLSALRYGADKLRDRSLQWIAVIDADGDHFANELVNLTRAALAARRRFGAQDILVIGRRASRHRPMGLLRGELEELADRVLLDALSYAAAQSGEPLPLQGVTSIEEFPDFHSGFKLFSRRAADHVFLKKPDMCNVDEDAYFRHGCEAVMTVEALQAGAQLMSVQRTTFNEQPVSTFGQLRRDRLVADKMIWPCRRLQIPPVFVQQWLRNHVPRLQLATLAPQGKQELLTICNLVAEAFSLPLFTADLTDGPLFV